MHFCSQCNNMYYIRIAENDADKLIYYCRKCGHQDELITAENICVSKTILKGRAQKFSHIINEYTKMDPTLTRVTNIKCPNENCEKDEGNKEIIYLRYDDKNMRYVYICTACDNVWTLDNLK